MTVYNNGWQPGQRFGLPSQNQMRQTALNTSSAYQIPLLPTSQSAGLNSMPAYNTGAPDMQTMLATMGSMVAAMTTSVMALITAVMQRRAQATPTLPQTPNPTPALPTPNTDPNQSKKETVQDTKPPGEGTKTDKNKPNTDDTKPEKPIEKPLSDLERSLKNIDYNDVRQGKYGDCVFEASLTSVAKTEDGKKQIAKMIKDNKDGTYTVTFPGDKDKPVKVTEEDLKNKESKNKEGWAKIIETAFVKAYPKQAQAKFPKKLNGKDATPAQQMLHLLMGESASKAAASDKDIGQKLDTQLNKQRHSVIAFCANDADKALTSGHEWTVTAYNADSKMVTVRNPWGRSVLKPGETKNGMTGMENGEVQMSLKHFKKYYKEVTHL